ncbi:DNA helicase RecQ, partial [bacterium]|nr:DNA helicase RecQ [bacterium]
EDQVAALRLAGVAAEAIHSGRERADNVATWRRVAAGQTRILYMAPERLMTERMLAALARLPLTLIAVDEAHCISQWGPAFRPEYADLARLKEVFPGVPLAALTATADEITRGDIAARLFAGAADIFVAGFDRPNISLTVEMKRDWKRRLADFVEEHRGMSGIVYCLSRKKTEEAAAYLRDHGIDAMAYHAGMDAGTRAANQQRFVREPGVVMVATIAFGMGIDKPDVRFVAHLDLPKSMEGYYQETGRAGRDGLPADAWMCYGLQDVVLLRRIVDEGEGDEMHRRRNHQQLDAILGYCEVVSCRRQVLLAYFGETMPEPCGNCDTCLDPPDTFDGLVTAQKALSCVARTGQRFGAQHVIDVLRGSENERLLRLGHDRLSTYGIGTELDAFGWRSVFRQLVAQGYLALDPDGYGGLRLTPAAGPVLKGAVDLRLRRDALEKKAVRSKTKVAEALTADVDGEVDASTAALFEKLRAVRLELAQAAGVPPYVVFHDKTLAAMALHRPVTAEQFLRLSGVGETKLERYGEAFLAVLREEAGSAPTDSLPADPDLF